MKHAVKLILCLLIAWLPLAGFAASVSICPDMSAAMTASPTMHQPAAQHTAAPTGAIHAATAVSTMHQSDCHGSIGSAGCNLAAITAPLVAVVAATAMPVYASFDAALLPQFIPDLPQRPPQVL
ncbi:hypothetical protein [Paraburkholderia dipogonis]|uniref:hypothetical protein n=1 Tax=Paraburkholderia dipogonis TaxID=1211383 RepID=UPI0038B7751E